MAQHLKAPRLASEPSGGEMDSPFLNAKECAQYLRFKSVGALYHAIKPQQIPVLRRGTILLFERTALEAWLRGERHTRDSQPHPFPLKGRAS